MNRTLKEIHTEREAKDTIASLKSQIEHLYWLLKNTNSGVTTPSSAVFSVSKVLELPAVPATAETFQMVFWSSEGTGDDKVWWTYTGLTRWYPMAYTTLDGTPGS